MDKKQMKCFTVNSDAGITNGIASTSIAQVALVSAEVDTRGIFLEASVERTKQSLKITSHVPGSAPPSALILLPAHLDVDARLLTPICNLTRLLALRDVRFDAWLIYLAPGERINLKEEASTVGRLSERKDADELILSWNGVELTFCSVKDNGADSEHPNFLA